MTASIRNRLSVVIIVRDAAEPLRLTLASIRDIADEIVVVDTGSTDLTRSVAAEFGARVYAWNWTDDFSAARNSAMTHVQGDWLLWLDAGETLSDEHSRGLKDFVIAQANPQQAYMLVVRLPAQDASASQEQVARPRLMPRHPAIQFAGRVWESPVESLSKLQLTLVGLPYIVRRGERELDARLKKQRAQRNMRIAELELQETGESPRLWNCMGDALMSLGNNGQAAECFRRAVALAERGSSAMLEAYYGCLTSLGTTEQEREIQLSTCVQALEIFPVDAQLLCALGGYLQGRGKIDLASQAYLTAFQFGQVNPTVWHVSEIRDIAAVCHSLTLQLRQQSDEAIKFLEGALADYAGSTRIRRRLIDVFIQQGARDSALAHVGELPPMPHLEAFRSAVRGACFAVQKNLIAAKAYLNASYTHGCRDPLCLKWLSLCLIATGDATMARRTLDEWQRLEPRNQEINKLRGALKPEDAPAASTLRIDTPSTVAGKANAPIVLNLPSWSPATQK